MDLVSRIYRETQSFPKTETYGLMSQLRRAAVSIPSNIAEGQARISTGEFRQFLGNARGSLMEVETQILVANDLGYMNDNTRESLLAAASEVGRMLTVFWRPYPTACDLLTGHCSLLLAMGLLKRNCSGKFTGTL